MVHIRFAKEEDYNLILKIDNSISRERWDYWTANRQAVLAFLNDDFAGWLQYGYFIEKTPFVNRLYVFEEYQRQTVGSFLLLFCEDAVKNLGHKQIMLSVEEENSAAEFYKRLGYRELGCFDYFGTHKELIYGKELHMHKCCQ